jgi:hypothetical protein
VPHKKGGVQAALDYLARGEQSQAKSGAKARVA